MPNVRAGLLSIDLNKHSARFRGYKQHQTALIFFKSKINKPSLQQLIQKTKIKQRVLCTNLIYRSQALKSLLAKVSTFSPKVKVIKLEF